MRFAQVNKSRRIISVLVLSLNSLPDSFGFSVFPAWDAVSASSATYCLSVDDSDHEVAVVDMSTPARQTLPSHLRLQPIPGKGLGVVTTTVIARNTAVGDYTGEIITTEVKDRRYLPSQKHLQQPDDVAWVQSRHQRGQGITGAYLYGVTMPGNVDPLYIDAEDEYASLWTRFLNHATEPLGNNLTPKSIHESYDGNPRVWFVSNRDIDIGEELCFDYGDDYWLPDDQVVV